MSEDKLYNNADDLLRAKFDGAVETPSDFVWENIEKKLDEPKKKRRFLFWFMPLALLLIATCIGLYTNKTKKDNIQPITTENNATNLKENGGTKSTLSIEINTSKKKQEFAAISTNNDTVQQFQQLKDIDTIAKNSFSKQRISITNTNEKLQKTNKNIAVTLFQKNKKKLPENSSLKKQFVSTKQQNISANTNLFSAVKSYADVSKMKKNSNPKYTIKSAETIDGSNDIADKQINKSIVLNPMLVADTIVKDTTNNTTKTTDTTNNKTAEAAKKKNKKTLDKYLKFYISPNVSNNSFAASSTAYDFLNEKGKFSFSIGASYSFAISNKFAISAGLGYDRLKFSLDNTPVTFGRFITKPYIFHSAIGDMAVAAATMKDGFRPASPTFPSQFTINYNYNYSLLYITIPIEVQYKLIDRKIKISITSGIATQFIIQQNATLNLVKERLTNTITYNSFDLNKTNFAASVGFNFQFPLNNKWCFYFEPTNKFLLTPLNKSALVSTKSSSFGLTIGAALKLSKK